MNARSHLKEVEAYDFVIVRVQGLKGFCGGGNKESHDLKVLQRLLAPIWVHSDSQK